MDCAESHSGQSSREAVTRSFLIGFILYDIPPESRQECGTLARWGWIGRAQTL
jgi:hypothetical protein